MASWTDVEVRLREYAQQYDQDFPATGNVERRTLARIAITPRSAPTSRWGRARPGVLVRELAMVCVVLLLVAALAVGVTKLRSLQLRPTSPAVGVPGTGPTVYFSALKFVSPDVGWIAESKNSLAGPTILYRTVDGGRSWKQQLRWEGPGPAEVRFSADGAEGLVVGNGGVPLFRTTDGGAHWQRMAHPPQADPVALLYFLDAREGWIVSYLNQATPGFAGVFHTTDGGQHWTLTARVDVNKEFSHGQLGGSLQGSLVFSDSSTGWFVAQAMSGTGIPVVPPFLYVTRDGGKTWTVQPLAAPVGVKMDSSTANVSLPQFFNQRQGVLMVTVFSTPNPNAGPTLLGTYVYSTTDGGDHWSGPQPVAWPAGFAGFRTMTVIDARNWMVLTNPRTLRTTDGGANWEVLTGGLPANAVITKIDFQDASSGWAGVVDATGHAALALYRTTDGGAHWTKFSVPDLGG